jgi:anti-sigma factor RsiW
VDNELDPASQKEFSLHLRTCPECSTTMLEEVTLQQAVRSAGRRFHAPPDLRLAVENKLRPRTRFGFAWRWGLAAACLVVATWVTVFLYSQKDDSLPAIAELVDLHVATLASPNPVDVISTDRHTVKPWFQGKLPFTFNLPELANSPFVLVGGKVAYLHQSPGAELIYEFRKHKISVFVFQTKSNKPSPLTLRKNSSFTTAAWEEGTLDCYLITDATGDEVHQLASMFQDANRS